MLPPVALGLARSLTAANSTGDDSSRTLTDLPLPTPPTVTYFAGDPVPPQHRLYFYSSDQWEEFILEWATGLTGYHQVKRLGGSGDHGVDVAGLKTSRGYEDHWDCFQGKHYSAPLTLGDVLPEMVKLFANVVAGYYQLPDGYYFLAPQGCGTRLNRLLAKPSELQATFLEHVQTGVPLVRGYTDEQVHAIRTLAGQIDFSVFRSVELVEALAVHRCTPYFAARFGGPLAPRPTVPEPPESVTELEARYVSQLLAVYAERFPGERFTSDGLRTHLKVGKHFRRQREAFFSAEALRLYARDAVPEGTFERLQHDVYEGVVEIAEAPHPSGWIRLEQVLSLATILPLSNHSLITVASPQDRKGICHQLANEEELCWVIKDEEPTK